MSFPEKINKNATEQFNITNVVVVFILIICVAFLVDISEFKQFIIDAGVWAPVIFVLLKIATIVIAPLSGSPLYPLVGLFFGFWPGLLYVALGDFLGYSVAFFISRIFGQRAVAKLVSKGERGLLSRMIEKIGTAKGFFHACLTCFALPELLSYAGGLSRLAYWKFILILWPASMIATTVLVFMGASFDVTHAPLIISLFVPLIGAICVIAGGYLFIKSLQNNSN